MQKALIASGIAALIIPDKAPVIEQIRTEAQERGVSVLTPISMHSASEA